MLILSRKKNETIQIGDGVAVTVIRVSGNKVRLGIVAPKGTRVLRLELDSLAGQCLESLRAHDAA